MEGYRAQKYVLVVFGALDCKLFSEIGLVALHNGDGQGTPN